MGLSYHDGFVSSDNASDCTWGTFDRMLHELERDAFDMDLLMRRAFSVHPAAGSEVLVETEGLGYLEQLAQGRFTDDPDEEFLGKYQALDFVTGAAQIVVGRPQMLSARWRRIVRESYRVLLWHARHTEITPRNGPRSSREPIDLGGPRPILVGIMDHPDAFARWVERALEHDTNHSEGRSARKVRGLIRPLSVYGEVQALVSTIQRGERWLRLASRMCEMGAPHVPVTETGFMKLPNAPDAGMVNLDTGEVDPRGFPTIRRKGYGIPTVTLRLPTLCGDSFEVHEIDQASDENPARFQARGNPFMEAEEDLVKIVLRHATRNVREMYVAWLRLGPELVEEVPSYTIPEVEALRSQD